MLLEFIIAYKCLFCLLSPSLFLYLLVRISSPLLIFCKNSGSCYSVALRDNHLCVENSMRHHCPICYEVCFICALLIYRRNVVVCDVLIYHAIFAVSLWFSQGHGCNEMWTHNALWMLWRDDKAWQVNCLHFSVLLVLFVYWGKILPVWFLTYFPYITQILLSHMLQVYSRHVSNLEEDRWGGRHIQFKLLS